MKLNGNAIHDQTALEHEADVMGEVAARLPTRNLSQTKKLSPREPHQIYRRMRSGYMSEGTAAEHGTSYQSHLGPSSIPKQQVPEFIEDIPVHGGVSPSSSKSPATRDTTIQRIKQRGEERISEIDGGVMARGTGVIGVASQSSLTLLGRAMGRGDGDHAVIYVEWYDENGATWQSRIHALTRQVVENSQNVRRLYLEREDMNYNPLGMAPEVDRWREYLGVGRIAAYRVGRREIDGILNASQEMYQLLEDKSVLLAIKLKATSADHIEKGGRYTNCAWVVRKIMERIGIRLHGTHYWSMAYWTGYEIPGELSYGGTEGRRRGANGNVVHTLPYSEW
jgi:hypothetical protein